jgi:hypothetical protein
MRFAELNSSRLKIAAITSFTLFLRCGSISAWSGFTQLEGRPGRETVRSLLRKKSDVFVRLEDGRYELKKT